ncbi:hypothetical protein A0J61_02648 [Choanephora cucurbitarum]|uniref:Uncharacterized protein n=1 Tax=Choanephora cucurbitarum TaxID=101091 RepID=A0A1C7NPY6_9FUNG|nr:hypothetical protein A0J61_02648 [Choanephora cucurbitarum]
MKNDAGHKMSMSAFVINDVLIASIYCSPRFSQRKALDEIEKLLTIGSNHKIIAEDDSSHFDDEQNPFAGLFDRYRLTHNMKSTLNSTTKSQPFIDNIPTDIADCGTGRYVHLTVTIILLYVQFEILYILFRLVVVYALSSVLPDQLEEGDYGPVSQRGKEQVLHCF